MGDGNKDKTGAKTTFSYAAVTKTAAATPAPSASGSSEQPSINSNSNSSSNYQVASSATNTATTNTGNAGTSNPSGPNFRVPLVDKSDKLSARSPSPLPSPRSPSNTATVTRAISPPSSTRSQSPSAGRPNVNNFLPPGLSHPQQSQSQSNQAPLSDPWSVSPPSGPRRQSLSFPQTPNMEYAAIGGGRYTPDPSAANRGVPSIETFDEDDEDDLVLSRKRNIRNRTASTPNAMLGIPGGASGFADYNNSNNAPPSTGGKWGWTNNNQQSIWNGDGSASAKQYRSLSFSLEGNPQLHQPQAGAAEMQRRGSFVNEDYPQPPSRARTPLVGVLDNDPSQQPNDFGFVSGGRSRSKSSAATYGLPEPYGTSPAGIDPMSSIWGQSDSSGNVLHRRASTQPGVVERSAWNDSAQREALRDAEDAILGLSLGPNDAAERYRRRHSHAPNMYTELSAQISPRNDPTDVYDSRRRHSVAGPPLYNNYLNDIDTLYDPKGEGPLFEGIDDYFGNTEHRAKAWVEAGKNLQKQATYVQQYWPVYVVEFKAGRIDYFHAGECGGQIIRTGDLVIVEADRGKDLGKVIHDNLANLAQLHMFQSQHKDIMVESLISGKEIQPKRIYGLAQQGEVALLVAKAQDEAKATAVCQAKIRQRKLPMEIVDAEYQWDRKKLTFYFVADRRVDFRELIRDLFKLYKTRIWMCAVDPTKMPRPF